MNNIGYKTEFEGFEWKKEYEKTSSDKLSLLGIKVLYEFENGMRAVKIPRVNAKDNIRLINIPEKINYWCKLENEYFTEYEYNSLFDLHILSSNTLHSLKGATNKSNKAVIFDKRGNVIVSIVLPQNLSSKEDFYKTHVRTAKSLTEHILENWEELYDYTGERKEKDLDKSLIVYKDKYFDAHKIGDYVIIKVRYDNKFMRILVIDTITGKFIVDSYGAFELETTALYEEDKKEEHPFTVLTYVTREKTCSIIPEQRKVIIMKNKQVDKLRLKNRNIEKFLSQFSTCSEIVRCNAYDKIDTMLKENGMVEWSPF